MEKNTMLYKMKFNGSSMIHAIDTVLDVKDCINLVQTSFENDEHITSGSVIDKTGKEVYHRQK